MTNVSDSGLMSSMRLILCDKIMECSARCPIRWLQIETGQIFSEPSQIEGGASIHQNWDLIKSKIKKWDHTDPGEPISRLPNEAKFPAHAELLYELPLKGTPALRAMSRVLAAWASYRLILCDKIIESSARCPIRWPQIETGQMFSEPSHRRWGINSSELRFDQI